MRSTPVTDDNANKLFAMTLRRLLACPTRLAQTISQLLSSNGFPLRSTDPDDVRIRYFQNFTDNVSAKVSEARRKSAPTCHFSATVTRISLAFDMSVDNIAVLSIFVMSGVPAVKPPPAFRAQRRR